MTVNKKLSDIANQLGEVVKEQMRDAKNALDKLPPGATKEALGDLLRKSSSGKISHEAAQKEIKKIIDNGGTD
jgi:hypothetical protein